MISVCLLQRRPYIGVDDIVAYQCPQVPSLFDEAQQATATLGNFRVYCHPSQSRWSWDYLPTDLGTSLSGSMIPQDHGSQRILAHIYGFPYAASYKRIGSCQASA
jgi:hypothetical protein